jgi:molybdate transport system substrate-binding protein
MRGLMADAVPLFERTGGGTVAVSFGLTSALKKEIEAGAAFDVTLLPRTEIDALEQTGKIAAGTAADVTRSAIGVAVRAGASKPDIASAAAFKRTLLEAHSLTYSDGPSGAYIGGLLDRLGIAAEMKSKTRLTTGPVAELVARGEAEIGLQQIVAILPVKGVELVGPLPGELQNVIIYAAGLSTGAQNGAAAQNFIAFLRSKEIGRLIRAKGLEPG